MTRTGDPFYDKVKLRVADLTDQQWRNVQQRVRSVKALVSTSLWLVAIDSAIDLELSGLAPAPAPCPDHPVTLPAPLPAHGCVQHPIGPLRVDPPDAGVLRG